MSKNTGGPAFPSTQDIRWERGMEGMTLRDFWQGQATAAWITALAARYAEPGYNDKDAALEASRLGGLTADFMLAERSKE